MLSPRFCTSSNVNFTWVLGIQVGVSYGISLDSIELFSCDPLGCWIMDGAVFMKNMRMPGNTMILEMVLKAMYLEIPRTMLL